ncbi:hypothetical protein HMN09_00801000 [Mycena chlorophos]|uniref:BTB domain-containing protein n=1 Tax=Mycena chlorophos TaxID=658473 RepID=A0A8H6SVA3_MYCCL|nr:hypothetical protein HMN09_00801000 [Mycena chlorophos]
MNEWASFLQSAQASLGDSEPVISASERQPSCRAPECSQSVDIVLRSSNGVLFGAHAANLAQFAAGFPPAEFVQKEDADGLEIVQLDERADVLELLLEYTHPQRQPHSKKWTFSLLAGLAEAVEKYMVYGAMEVCKRRMEAYATACPHEVLSYAVKHGYSDIRDMIIPTTLSWDLAEIQSALQDPALIIAWVAYREQYLKLSIALRATSAETILHRGGKFGGARNGVSKLPAAIAQLPDDVFR